MKRLLAVLALLTLLLGACGSDEPSAGELPDGKKLLQDSSKVMDEVDTVAFNLNIEGNIGVFSIKDAVGVITRDGEAKATAHLNQGGRIVEYEYVQAGGQAYLKGPTGGFQPLPEAIAARFFDPTALLTGEKSLSKGLAQGTNARTEAIEEVEGIESYRVGAAVETSKIEGLILLASGSIDNAKLWIARDTKRLVKAVLPFTVPNEDGETVVTVTFSRYDEDVDIQAPS